jgi:glyoxylase-like metal-dependent hydrolase (beta-lactamase superfamily II)
MNQKKMLPVSDHFKLEQLTEGVFAAIASENGAAFSNAGIIDLGDITVIFDTFETPKAASDLKAAAESLTGRHAAFVINSHNHADHWFGNQVFDEQTTIVATNKTRDQMPVYIEELKSLKINPSEMEDSLVNNQKMLQDETDPLRRAGLLRSISRLKYSLEALPSLELKIPNQTFEGKLFLYGSQRSAEIIGLEQGHTSGDCLFTLREEKVAFLGDLAFFQRQPYMTDCEPMIWKRVLDGIGESSFETFVPGHGQIGTKKDITMLSDYLTILDDLVSQVIRSGGTVEDALKLTLPTPYDLWQQAGNHRFDENVRFFFQYLTNTQP